MSKRMAFLVGINNYGESSGLSELNYAESDVELMVDTLEKNSSFSTKTLMGKEATQTGIIKRLHEFDFEDDLNLFLFYFAGHGELIRGAGTYCLHCYGSEMGDTVGTLNMQELANRIKKNIKAQQIVLIIDACRNKVYRGAQLRGTPGLDSSVCSILKKISNTSRHVILTPKNMKPKLVFTLLSCGVEQVSYEDSELKHGIFTYALAKEIKENGAKLPLNKLSLKVGDYTYNRCIKNNWKPIQIPEWFEPLISTEVYIIETLNANLPDNDEIIGKAVSNIIEAHPSPYGTQGYVRRYEKGSFYLLKKVGKPKRKSIKIEENKSFRLSNINIEARYENMGGSRSILGFPVEEVQAAWRGLKDNQELHCMMQAFEGGNIYFCKGCGVHTVLKGSIKFLLKESEQNLLRNQNKKVTGGVFGFPISDQMEVSSVTKAAGQAQRFEYGIIIDWSGGVFGIRGACFDLYQSLGEWTSSLGFPVSNEQPLKSEITDATGIMQTFENGCMIWNKKNDRCFYIAGEIFQKWKKNSSRYAFPINNPYTVEFEVEQLFEGGKIVIEKSDPSKKISIKKKTAPTPRPIKKEKMIARHSNISSQKSDDLFKLSKEQLGILSRIHEQISCNLSSVLNFYLSTHVHVKPHSLEGFTYAKFTHSLPAATYMNAISMTPSEKISALAINLKLLFSMIDILNRRGIGRSSQKRAITKQDRGEIDGLVRTILEGIEKGWEEILTFNISVLQTGTSPQSITLLDSSEQVVSISFELTIGKENGLIHFCIPDILLQSISEKLQT